MILLSAHPLRVFKPAGGWAALSFFAALLILLPLGALAVVAAGPSAGLWPHLAAYVLPQAAADTAALLLGVGLVTIIVGTGTAWLVTAYEFPGRAWLDWALLLPLLTLFYDCFTLCFCCCFTDKFFVEPLVSLFFDLRINSWSFVLKLFLDKLKPQLSQSVYCCLAFLPEPRA